MSQKLKLLLSIWVFMALFGCSKEDQAIAEIKAFISQSDIDTQKVGWKLNLPKPPKLTFEPGIKYYWRLQTNKGNLLIEFKPAESPMHVSSTIYLTTLGFYDGLTFHRVIPKFMAQGGDPLGEGIGGPGYTYNGEFESDLSHDKKGILSMANAGAGTDGSQFFITFKPVPYLDGRHTIFGEVIEGFDTLANLEQFGSRSGRTKEELKIIKATVQINDTSLN